MSATTRRIQTTEARASGIRRDHDAVVAGIERSWSNGQVEGQVHRLELLKRQMYGRSGFLLLRTWTFTTLFSLVAVTGLRISEALNLRLHDVTEDGLAIRETKFQKSRLVPLHPTTVVGLRRYLDRRGTVKDDHVFVSLRGGGMRYSGVVFDKWGEYLSDGPLAMAFLDRLVEGAIILKVKGKSYRAEGEDLRKPFLLKPADSEHPAPVHPSVAMAQPHHWPRLALPFWPLSFFLFPLPPSWQSGDRV